MSHPDNAGTNGNRPVDGQHRWPIGLRDDQYGQGV